MSKTLQDKLAALDQAVTLAQELDEPTLSVALAPAHDLLTRAGQRRALAPLSCVVALLGATGSGKSSLFNALLGSEVAQASLRRPTTTAPLAALSPTQADEASELLDWLEVTQRAWVPADLGERTILLDLPDIDSDEPSHRASAARLAGMVDVLVWVLDPQKYADGVVHHGFLAPMAAHSAVSVVVLNQVDRLTQDEQAALACHLSQLLAGEGWATVAPVLVSARTGQGVEKLRDTIRQVAGRREAASARLEADLRTVARAASQAVAGPGEMEGRASEADQRAALAELEDAAAAAAGVETVTRAVGRSLVLQAAGYVGWPPLRWVARLRKDPLRGLHLSAGRAGQPTGQPRGVTPRSEVIGRSSLPPVRPAASGRLRTAARQWSAALASHLPEPARDEIVSHGEERAEALLEDLDVAVSRTPLIAPRTPRWWSAASVLQWALVWTALAGGAWLGLTHLLRMLLLMDLQPPRWGLVPWPAVLLVGGVVLGLVAWVLGRALARAGARRAQRRAARRLREATDGVVHSGVVEPARAEVSRWEDVRRVLSELAAPERR